MGHQPKEPFFGNYFALIFQFPVYLLHQRSSRPLPDILICLVGNRFHIYRELEDSGKASTFPCRSAIYWPSLCGVDQFPLFSIPIRSMYGICSYIWLRKSPRNYAIRVNAFLASYAGPGAWNDPDMLVGSSPEAACHMTLRN